MKIIAAPHPETILVEMSEKELRTITGRPYNDDLINNTKRNQSNGTEIDLIELVGAFQTVKGIPAELKSLKSKASIFLEEVTKAEEALTKLPVLSTKVVSV